MQINTRLSPSTFWESLGTRLVHCNTHRSWYWPKHVPHSGWLCITLRPVFKGEVVHWLFIHLRCYSFTHIRNWLVVTLLTGRLISHSLYATVLHCVTDHTTKYKFGSDDARPLAVFPLPSLFIVSQATPFTEKGSGHAAIRTHWLSNIAVDNKMLTSAKHVT